MNNARGKTNKGCEDVVTLCCLVSNAAAYLFLSPRVTVGLDLVVLWSQLQAVITGDTDVHMTAMLSLGVDVTDQTEPQQFYRHNYLSHTHTTATTGWTERDSHISIHGYCHCFLYLTVQTL